MDTIFFIASKVFWPLARPDSWLLALFLLALFGLMTGRARLARFALGAGVAAFLAIGFLPLGVLLVRPLENRFPAAPDIANPAGIVILGGAEEARMAEASGQVELNGAAERIVLGLVLAIEHPGARVVVTGGSGSLVDRSAAGAVVAGEVLSRAGLEADRVVLETASRNTAENATLTLEAVGRETPGPWVLVTSAFHMPRSMGAFCQAGWRDIIPYPVDFHGAAAISFDWDFADRLHLVNVGVREWIGLAAYRLTGRIPAFLPGGC